MMRSGYMPVLVLGLWLGSLPVSWGNVDERFASIKQRNMFGLREPPPPPPPPAPPPPSTTVKLTGITCLFSTKKAILQVTEQGKPADSKIMTEGSREGSVEVLEVNPDLGTVKIINNGQEVTLSFEKDGVKPSAAPPGSPGGPPALPLPGIPVGGPQPAVHPQTSIPGAYGIPNLGGRSAPGSTTVTPTGSGYIPGAYGNPVGGMASPINGVAFRFDGQSTGLTSREKDPTYVPDNVKIDTEQQMLLMEVNNQIYKKQRAEQPPNSRVAVPPPLPPTPLSDAMNKYMESGTQPPGLPAFPSLPQLPAR